MTPEEIIEEEFYSRSDDDGLDSDSDDETSSFRNRFSNRLDIIEEEEDDESLSVIDISLGDEKFSEYSFEDSQSEQEPDIPVPGPSRVSKNSKKEVCKRKTLNKVKTSRIQRFSKRQKCKTQTFSKIKWKKKQFSLKQDMVEFKGYNEKHEDIEDLETVLDFFWYFFPKDLTEHIATESSLYSKQINPNQPLNMMVSDIMKYLGICIFSSVVQIKNFRYYWNRNTGLDFVKRAMSCNHFERIRRYLHFNNNINQKPIGEHGYDRLYKIRPVIETLKKRFYDIPMPEKLSVDEQICATKARSYLKVYMPSKPHKYGYKLYLLCDMDGFCHDFEIYTGKVDENLQEKDIGVSSNIVARMIKNVPKFKNHKIFFDNYFNSIPLQLFLHERGLHGLGTVRRNRLKNITFSDEKVFSKQERGAVVERSTQIGKCKLAATMWKDNKTVTLLSTYLGKDPVSSVLRYNRKMKKKEQVSCPAVVLEYNKHMGGVDFLDSMIGRYHIILRSKKWYFRLFYHMLELAVINAWVLYKKHKKMVTLLDFRLELAEALCGSNLPRNTPRRGRPKNLRSTNTIQTVRKQRSILQPKPIVDVRKDNMCHWPTPMKKGRCKNPPCKGFSRIGCSKCKVNLCITRNKNCFLIFHTE